MGPRVSISEQTFAELFAQSSRTLWCLAAAVLGRPEAAEDVLQDAAMTALGKLEDLVDPAGFEAWMGQIVRFTALNARRRRDRDRKVAGDGESDPTTALPAPRLLPRPAVADDGTLLPDQDAFDDHVQEALGSLDEIPRACLLLKVVMDLGYKEISSMLGIPEGTAMSHVHRARQRLKARLTSDEGSTETSTGGAWRSGS